MPTHVPCSSRPSEGRRGTGMDACSLFRRAALLLFFPVSTANLIGNVSSSNASACVHRLAVSAGISAVEEADVRVAHEVALQLAAGYTQPRSAQWSPSTVEDLHQQYSNIFQYGNRNAASHRWSTFILDRAFHMTSAQLQLMFSGFCTVSGSPVRPGDYNRYGLTLPLVPSVAGNWAEGAEVFGYLHYCCWPCVCDAQDFIRIDTRRIVTTDSRPEGQLYHFAVLGNPCSREQLFDEQFPNPFGQGSHTIRGVAPEVRCSDNMQLEGATLSDNGYVIVGMFFDAEPVSNDSITISTRSSFTPTPGRLTTHASTNVVYNDEREFKERCEERKQNGYDSGMGEIFRRVAGISPIFTHTVKLGPCANESHMPSTSDTSTTSVAVTASTSDTTTAGVAMIASTSDPSTTSVAIAASTIDSSTVSVAITASTIDPNAASVAITTSTSFQSSQSTAIVTGTPRSTTHTVTTTIVANADNTLPATSSWSCKAMPASGWFFMIQAALVLKG